MAPDPRIVKGRPFGIQPGRVNCALVELRCGQARRRRRLAGGGRVERAGVIHSPRQNGGPELWGDTHYVDRVGLHEVSLVPVIRDPVHTAERHHRRERPICSRSLLPRLSCCCISATDEIEIVK
jgi:hypothetical protein